MKQPAAKLNDLIQATDLHSLIVGPSVVPTLLPFSAPITRNVSLNVKVMGLGAATVGSSGDNTPPHVGSFVVPPSNVGTIKNGSSSVLINQKPAARNLDDCITCHEGPPIGKVVASGTVLIGGGTT